MHIDFSPAIGISSNVSIVCGGLVLSLELKKISNICWFAAFVFETVGFLKRVNGRHPYVKQQWLSNAQFRIEFASQLCNK